MPEPRADPEPDLTVEVRVVGLVVDHLLPVVAWYRAQLARRLGVGPADLTVLDVTRAHPDNASAGRLARWTAMTPSAVAKVTRRLEDAGHLARVADPWGAQELGLELLPHEERDLLLHLLRADVGRALEPVLRDPARVDGLITALEGLLTVLGRSADDLDRRHAGLLRHHRRLRTPRPPGDR